VPSKDTGTECHEKGFGVSVLPAAAVSECCPITLCAHPFCPPPHHCEWPPLSATISKGGGCRCSD